MSSPTLKIFLVEDNEIYLKTLEFHLNKKFAAQVSVSTFLSGEACLEALGEKPDLIVLDHHLDDTGTEAMTGLETLKKIREKIPNVAISMLSAQESYRVAAQSVAGGALNYIVKDDNSHKQLAEIIQGMIR